MRFGSKGENKNEVRPRIGIIGDALAPHFNNAPANQMYLLSQELRVPVLTGNNLGFMPFKRMGRYLIVNTKFLRKRTPFLSLFNGAFFYPFVKLFERKFDVIYLPAGIDSGFLNYLNLKKCVLVINSLPFTEESKQARMFVQTFAPKLRGIIAQSKRIKAQLTSMGVESETIRLVYPWVDLDKFRYSEPPNTDEFRILFASAPEMESVNEDVFVAKGLPLLLETFKEFTKHDKASLCLLWRSYYNDALYTKIRELDLADQVNVINEVADMSRLYAQSHITVIPFLDTRRSPEIPLSAVESLACGRPVVTTNVAEIVEIIEEYACGCVANPVKEDFLSALVDCKKNYSLYQANCRNVAEELFTPDMKQLLGDLPWSSCEPAHTKFNITIVTSPFDNVRGEVNLTNLLQTLEPMSDNIFAIVGNLPEYPNKKVKITRLVRWRTEGKPLPIKMLKHTLTDLQISLNLLKVFRNVDIVAFHIGARYYLLSVFLSKLLRRRILAFSFNTASKIAEVSAGQKGFKKSAVVSARLANILEKAVFFLADQIAVESESVIKFSKIESYRDKIAIYGPKYVNLSLFKIERELECRREIVGYIGGLSYLKGVLNLVKAISLVLNKRHDVEFLIGGEGPLLAEIEEQLNASGLHNKVKIIGTIPKGRVPDYLNEMKLFVLPSYTEGVPGIVQEAMACGTPVLATPVGGVPDLIKNGKTGFILADNSPECIAMNVIAALNHPKLDEITKNARELMKKEYSYNIMVEKWRVALCNLLGRKADLS